MYWCIYHERFFDEVASIDFDRVASTSNREVLRELNQAFSTERSENFAAPNYRPEGKRFKTVTAEELDDILFKIDITFQYKE
jgi:hypothetical protein